MFPFCFLLTNFKNIGFFCVSLTNFKNVGFFVNQGSSKVLRVISTSEVCWCRDGGGGFKKIEVSIKWKCSLNQLVGVENVQTF